MSESRGYQLAGCASRPPAPFIQPSIRRPVPRGSLRDGKPPAARKIPPDAVGLPDRVVRAGGVPKSKPTWSQTAKGRRQ